MCSFRGSYANRGNGTELSPSDVVRLGNPNPNRFRFAWGSAGGDWVFPPAYLSEADHCQPQAGHQKRDILSDAPFLVPVVGLEPTRCRHRRILNPLRLPFHHTGVLMESIPYFP